MTFQIPARKIGNSSVPPVGFGAMSLGGALYGAAGSDEERFKVCDKTWSGLVSAF